MTAKEALIAEYTRCYNRWSKMEGHLPAARAREYQKLIEQTEAMPDNITGWDYINLTKNRKENE